MRVVNKPLPQSAQQERKSRENFSSWLKGVPFEFLQDIYRHYRIRRDIPFRPFIVDSAPSEKQANLSDKPVKDIFPPTQPIILRKSVFFLVFSLLGIEVFFDLVYLGFRILFIYVDLSQFTTPFRLDSLYFGLFVVLNLSKV